MAGQAVGGLDVLGCVAGQADLDQRAAGPLAVRQVVAVDGELGLVGVEPDGQAVPAGLPRQALDGQAGAAGRLDGQALLGPAEDGADRLGAGRAAEQEVGEPLLAGDDLAAVVEGDLQPPRADRLGQAAGQRRPAGRDAQAVLLLDPGRSRRSRGRRSSTIGRRRSPRTPRPAPAPRPTAGRPPAPPAGPRRRRPRPSCLRGGRSPRRWRRGAPRSAAPSRARRGTAGPRRSGRGRGPRNRRPSRPPAGSTPPASGANRNPDAASPTTVPAIRRPSGLSSASRRRPGGAPRRPTTPGRRPPGAPVRTERRGRAVCSSRRFYGGFSPGGKHPPGEIGPLRRRTADCGPDSSSRPARSPVAPSSFCTEDQRL